MPSSRPGEDVNERTAVIIARKSRGEIGIVSMIDAELLSRAESVGTGGTEGANDASSGSAADGAMEAGMWGSSTGTVGGGGSSTGSLSGMGGAPITKFHFSIVKTVVQTRRCSNWGLVGKPRCSNT